ncbi:spermine synthase [Melioribacter roseus P3M-2]|uniref:Spermine synthase n=1 Tax=Melioribacter roseus (strain DSM 23840 / JCM 17771 / VKM B-2668 / P3M-2) TaxID=1191523 RepID=I7A4D1_MELRP|nr:spermine synthase [Melioribacter roseus]AFN76068.1 spermine synthase [Melioribacter roseus P3M-2]
MSVKRIYLILLTLSLAIISFEIISTRISSVIFVSNYAFLILSLAILGIGLGSIYAHYRVKAIESDEIIIVLKKYIVALSVSLIIFILSIVLFKITNPYVYFSLQTIPFFTAGILYSQIYKVFSFDGFRLYASDLSGAAIGAVASIPILNNLGAVNGVLFVSLLLLTIVIYSFSIGLRRSVRLLIYSLMFLSMGFLLVKGDDELIGEIPIGYYPEKDFYYVYPDAKEISEIEESRWSINGRSDLVKYKNQDMVKQLFIDGSAGSQMYRFGGDVKNPGSMLGRLLIQHSTSIPFLLLNENEKNRMLVIGPGGGKEILVGLIEGVKEIYGVEVNSDFVRIVKEQKEFNGGIYTDFSNVKILIDEGRNYIKRANKYFDLIVMASPSTEQLQNIDNIASNENYLLTVEAIKDYLNRLTQNGRLIFTVHNRWELIRLLVTAIYAFDESGINNRDALNHFIVIGQDYAPTLVIKKTAFSQNDISNIKNTLRKIPKSLPQVTYLPFSWNELDKSPENLFLSTVYENIDSIEELIKKDKYDISPVRDDSPFFYKVNRGVPDDLLKLFIAIVIIGLLVVAIPAFNVKRIKKEKIDRKELFFTLLLFVCIGAGFMIMEIALFQKLILYLGIPTVSLSVLLSSLLIGMGMGSFYSKKIIKVKFYGRLRIITLFIVIYGIILFTTYPLILDGVVELNLAFRAFIIFMLLLPLAFMLGVPFPAGINLLKEHKLEKYIPWLYGVNGLMSVAGSVLAVIFSMTLGFTFSFFVGLFFYSVITVITWNAARRK